MWVTSSSEEHIHNELKPSRVARDSSDLKKLVEGIKQSCNPFTTEASANLYNIATGKAVSPLLKEDMLKFRENGERWCEEFKQECHADEARFEKSIKRRKVNNLYAPLIKLALTINLIIYNSKWIIWKHQNNVRYIFKGKCKTQVNLYIHTY